MKRRRLLEEQYAADRARWEDEKRRMVAVIARQEQRILDLTGQRNDEATARARAEARTSAGMCPDRATCVATCSAADHWRQHLKETQP